MPRPLPPRESFEDLIAIIRTLRTDCPWDREQTNESIAPLIIEEAYELKEAIQEQNDEEFRKELGDILLHVIMHSVIAEERDAFTLEDVIRTLSDKLVARHPHVYGETTADNPAEVSRNWEQQKMKEGRTSIYDGMPKGLPALQRAGRVQEKASKLGFDWQEINDVWKKVDEELMEFREGSDAGSETAVIEDEFGDLLFSLVNVSRFLGLNAEEGLQRTTDRFIRRFREIERMVREANGSIDAMSLEELDRLWDRAKERERRLDP